MSRNETGNTIVDDQLLQLAVPTVKRAERRRSKQSISHLGKKGDEAVTNVDQKTTNQDNSLPLKIFDGTKKAISDVSEQSRSYFWLRRIKEIFLHMGTSDSPFVDFDMSLARVDMLITCDIYLQNDLSKLRKKV